MPKKRKNPEPKIKKFYGQHFLRDQNIINEIIKSVEINNNTQIFEIGCGDGFLTRTILKTAAKTLWVFEIDAEWTNYVKEKYSNPKMKIFNESILDTNFEIFKPGPWTLLANLPYQITFPILKLLYQNRSILKEGTIMIQEEVAQKLVAKPGETTSQSLFFSHYFELKLLNKIPPEAFYPPPKVFSRLVHLKPKINPPNIPNENEFWKFIKLCFRQRRRTLKNNLIQGHFSIERVPEKFLNSRAQELSMEDFLVLWKNLNPS